MSPGASGSGVGVWDVCVTSSCLMAEYAVCIYVRACWEANSISGSCGHWTVLVCCLRCDRCKQSISCKLVCYLCSYLWSYHSGWLHTHRYIF